MQLVLLSGGSGKRLWPLSNNARSKQFLALLEKEDGGMESMVQRVVRQARAAQLTNDITLATNASQLDIITNQLGDTVSVVTEPERRDTFPAIALAASYLKFTKGCNDDEVVVIMPCDPYTEAGYFHTIAKMVQCVERNVADLVLMGDHSYIPICKVWLRCACCTSFRRQVSIFRLFEGFKVYREAFSRSCQSALETACSMERRCLRLSPRLHDVHRQEVHPERIV